jgi:hypothetical protein
MLSFVSLPIEFLRTRPAAVVWLAALLQAALWLVVPMLFYASPPGQVPELLAFGREFQMAGHLGAPLADWTADWAFRALGIFGVYLLAQACVVATYWAVFRLGRDVVGAQHAAMAVLLMTGIFVFTAPTAEFGPSILAMPIWALTLLHAWRAIGQKQRFYWLLLAIDIALLLLTSQAGLILAGLLLLYALATRRGRDQFTWPEPYIGGVILMLLMFPVLTWIDLTGGVSFPALTAIDENIRAWARLLVVLAIGHVGLFVLVLLARGLPFAQPERVPEFDRQPISPDGRVFVLLFALVPALAMVLFAALAKRPDAFITGPLVVLSGLAVVVAAGERIRLVHHQVIAYVWTGLLVITPVAVAASVVLSPWIFGSAAPTARPANDLGQFFGDTFHRRTGRPLAIVAGDRQLAELIAMAAPSRPSLYLDATPERSPWVTRADIEQKGAVVVWFASDTRGLPPPEITARFPDLVPEVPRAFERRFQGRLPLMRIGWAMIRPRAQTTPPAP